MKLVKENKKEPEFNKRYLIPSIIAVGLIPLIVHVHTSRTYLENEEWFAAGSSTYADLYLFWKQWALIVLASVCVIILLVRAKYYYEELPWEKRAFFPALIYGALVILSACFAKKHIFAFAGGYDMYQSAFALLSYLIIAYYTYTCIKSEDHILYLLRGSVFFITIEMAISFFEVIGKDFITSKAGRIFILDPSMWNTNATLNSEGMIAGTLYNSDFMSMYVPILLPLLVVLVFAEKKPWRKLFCASLSAVSFFVMYKAALSGILAIIAALIVSLVIASGCRGKMFIATIAVISGVTVCVIASIGNIPALKSRIANVWRTPYEFQKDSSMPVKSIVTGASDEGIRMTFLDGKSIVVKFSLGDDGVEDLKVYDADGTQLTLSLSDQHMKSYTIADQTYATEKVLLYTDTSLTVPTLGVNVAGGLYRFTNKKSPESTDTSEYYHVSSAGRVVKLPQKNPPEVAEVFPNGFWSGRGPIYNRCIPLLKKYILIGAGADNFIMAFPQRDYLHDPYIWGTTNSINIKPHSYYLQVWIQEGLLALIAMMAFLGWYLIRSIRLYRNIDWHDHTQVMGLAVMSGVIAYLIAVIANDSNICTGPVFWTVLGLGWGINTLVEKKGK